METTVQPTTRPVARWLRKAGFEITAVVCIIKNVNIVIYGLDVLRSEFFLPAYFSKFFNETILKWDLPDTT